MVHCISYYHRIKPTIRIPTTSGLAGYDKIQPAYWTPESDICSNISLQICVRFALGVDVSRDLGECLMAFAALLN